MRWAASYLAIAMLGGVAALAVGGVQAADEGPRINASEQKSEGASAMALAADELALAQQLALYGRDNGDPLALIVAAGIAGKYQVAASDAKPRETMTPAADAVPAPPASADEMLQLARSMAGDRTDLVALIDDAAAATGRGSTTGPGHYNGYVGAYQTVRVDEAFYGGDVAVVTVQGASSDIDLWVYDEYGNLICDDQNYSAFGRCQWTPRWTGRFTIAIENEGKSRGTNFTLWTN
jgi:hypothetical protein